jgi:beta-lactam-binding protein with PASTA domain
MDDELELIVLYKKRRIPSIKENTVYQQSIAPGERVARDTKIQLLISTGSK